MCGLRCWCCPLSDLWEDESLPVCLCCGLWLAVTGAGDGQPGLPCWSRLLWWGLEDAFVSKLIACWTLSFLSLWLGEDERLRGRIKASCVSSSLFDSDKDRCRLTAAFVIFKKGLSFSSSTSLITEAIACLILSLEALGDDAELGLATWEALLLGLSWCGWCCCGGFCDGCCCCCGGFCDGCWCCCGGFCDGCGRGTRLGVNLGWRSGSSSEVMLLRSLLRSR